MFHNVISVSPVSWCFTRGFMFYKWFMLFHVLQVFHDVLLCLTMFYDVQWDASQHRRPPIASGIVTVPQGPAITLQKSAMMPQGSAADPMQVICTLRCTWLSWGRRRWEVKPSKIEPTPATFFLKSLPCGVNTRSGKGTQISMISNSAIHLRSYTNTAITDIDGNSVLISQETPHKSQGHRAKRWCRIEWRVFHDVSQCYKSVSHFTSVSWRLTMFYNV